MKTKRFKKQLRLNKVTMANLDPAEMLKMKGADGYTNPGGHTLDPGCETDPYNTLDKVCQIYSCDNCTWPWNC
jgi:hypothetical protein